MRKLFGFGLTMVLLVALMASPGVAGDKPWFDMANCSMCKNLTAHPELMSQMTWKHYDLSNGLMSVTTVTDAARGTYMAACETMKATGEKLMAGEEMPLCGACDNFKALLKEGANTEMVVTDFGTVRLSTSDNPEVVEHLHAWAARTADEMAKMQGMEMKKASN